MGTSDHAGHAFEGCRHGRHQLPSRVHGRRRWRYHLLHHVVLLHLLHLHLLVLVLMLRDLLHLLLYLLDLRHLVDLLMLLGRELLLLLLHPRRGCAGNGHGCRSHLWSNGLLRLRLGLGDLRCSHCPRMTALPPTLRRILDLGMSVALFAKTR